MTHPILKGAPLVTNQTYRYVDYAPYTKWLLAVALVLILGMLTGCGSVGQAQKVLSNTHDEVNITYNRGADIQDLENPTPQDYEIIIRLRGKLPLDNGADPLSTLAGAAVF